MAVDLIFFASHDVTLTS